MQHILTQWIKTSDTVLRKIYLSLYLKGCVWEGVGVRTDLQHIDPHSYGHQRCVFLVLLLLNRRLRGSAFCWLSLPHLVTNSSDLQLIDFLSPPSYIIVPSPTQYLWNGMFNRHQAEITVMQFRGHSLPVHQSMSVPWDFYLGPFFQPSPPTRFLLITAIGMCHFLPVHHFGMACWPGRRSIYNNCSRNWKSWK